MEIPRFFSSGSRSVSFPVRARTSHVLPWSMWPAVPTVSAIAPGAPSSAGACHRVGHLVDLAVGESAAVEKQPSVADDSDHGRLAGAQRAGQLFLDRAGVAR